MLLMLLEVKLGVENNGMLWSYICIVLCVIDDCSSTKGRILVHAPETYLGPTWMSPGSIAYALGLARPEGGAHVMSRFT